MATNDCVRVGSEIVQDFHCGAQRHVGQLSWAHVVLAIVLVTFILGWIVPPALHAIDSTDGLALDRAERVHAEQSLLEVYRSVWDAPVERLAYTYVTVVDAYSLPLRSTPTCPSDFQYGAPCIPTEFGPAEACPATEGRWIAVRLRAHTWWGIPLSEAVMFCGGSGARLSSESQQRSTGGY
jgi:hypothetical protein